MAQRRPPHTEPVEPPQRPRLADQPSRFVLLEREVELEYGPQMLEALQCKVNTVAKDAHATVPECPQCGRPMTYHDARPVSWLAHRWVHQIAEDLRAGKVQEVIAALKRLRPKTAELRESLQSLIGYYSENAGRMRYDEYLRLGYGIGSGAVESAHKQVVHARLRQAGMRWSEAGARRLLALRLLLLNGDWALLDRMRMVSLA